MAGSSNDLLRDKQRFGEDHLMVRARRPDVAGI